MDQACPEMKKQLFLKKMLVKLKGKVTAKQCMWLYGWGINHISFA